MKRAHYFFALLGISLAFTAGCFTGAWSERDDWRTARAHVIEHLKQDGYDPKFLGPTEVHENAGQPTSYGFTYKNGNAHLDFVVSFGGPRGIEMSYWDYARQD